MTQEQVLAMIRGPLELTLRALITRMESYGDNLRRFAVASNALSPGSAMFVNNWRSVRDDATRDLNAGEGTYKALDNLPGGIRTDAGVAWTIAVGDVEDAMRFTAEKSIYRDLRTDAARWLEQRGITVDIEPIPTSNPQVPSTPTTPTTPRVPVPSPVPTPTTPVPQPLPVPNGDGSEPVGQAGFGPGLGLVIGIGLLVAFTSKSR